MCKYTCWCFLQLGYPVCVQVQPPDSPPCPSPLQASLHSQGSEGSGPQDDFVMVDFVRNYCSVLFCPCFPLGVQQYTGRIRHNTKNAGAGADITCPGTVFTRVSFKCLIVTFKQCLSTCLSLCVASSLL